MNAFTAVRYMREILRNSTGDKVLVDRAQLRAVVIAAERSPRFAREQSIAQRLSPKADRCPSCGYARHAPCAACPA